MSARKHYVDEETPFGCLSIVLKSCVDYHFRLENQFLVELKKRTKKSFGWLINGVIRVFPNLYAPLCGGLIMWGHDDVL